MKLYGFGRSSSAWRVRIVLALKAVEVQHVDVDIARGKDAQLRPEYGAVNPLRQVPVLEWEEGGEVRRLSQSVAIVEWLEDRFPDSPVFPADPWRRARARQLVEMVNAGIQPLQNNRVLKHLGELGADETGWGAHYIRRGLVAVEAALDPAVGPFALGAEPGVADAFIYPQLFNAGLFGVTLDGLPRLAALQVACDAHAAFHDTHPQRVSAP